MCTKRRLCAAAIRDSRAMSRAAAATAAARVLLDELHDARDDRALVAVCRRVCTATVDGGAGWRAFHTARARDELARAIARSTSDEAREWTCGALHNVLLCATQRVRMRMCTTNVRDAFVSVASAAGNNDACHWAARAILVLVHTCAANARFLNTVKVRDALLRLLTNAAEAATRAVVCDVIAAATDPAGTEALYCTADACVAFRACVPYLEETRECEAWVEAVCNLTAAGSDGAPAFVNPLIVAGLAQCATRARDTKARSNVVNAMRNLLHHGAEARRMFSTPAVRVALFALLRETSGDALIQCEALCVLRDILIDNANGQRVFGGAEACAFLAPLCAAHSCVGDLCAQLSDDDDAAATAALARADQACAMLWPNSAGCVTSFFTCVLCGDTRARAVARAWTARSNGAPVWYVCDGNDGRCRTALCKECRRKCAQQPYYNCACTATTLPNAAPAALLRAYLELEIPCGCGCGAREPLVQALDASASKRVCVKHEPQ